MKTERNSSNLENTISALILSFGGIALAIGLKYLVLIREATFISLILISVVVGIFVRYSDMIRSFNLLKGEIILKDMKETESSIKELARAILEVTETSSFGIMSEDFDSEAKNKAVEKLRKLTT